MTPSVRSKWLDIIGQVIFCVLMEQDRVEACSIMCEQALWGTLVAGWEKEGELATMSPEFEYYSTSNSPVAPRRLSCQIFANQHEAETSVNVNKH